VVPIHIPPLRERPDDLSALVGHFLRRLTEKYRGPRQVLGENAWATDFRYPWPGNLRELARRKRAAGKPPTPRWSLPGTHP
jgi:transcriptional regulator with PAS, ATPase and Fis domain